LAPAGLFGMRVTLLPSSLGKPDLRFINLRKTSEG